MTDIFSPFTTWLHTLPLWSQPVVATAIVCFAVFLPLMIRHRVSLHRRGEQFTKSKSKPAELIGMMLIFGIVFYFRDKYPVIPLILEWPDRAFPYYHQHGMAMWAGFTVGSFAAQMISALFAALFLRGGGRRSGRGRGVMVGTHDLLPDPPLGFGWYRKPTPQGRIIGTRTRTTYEEE